MPETHASDVDMLDLMVAWEERRAAGEPITPEELCRNHPNLLEALRESIARVTSLAPVLALAKAPPVELHQLPGYELQGELGRGGMGVVYRARDCTLGRTVAIKVPFAGPRGIERFKREGRTLAALQHPNIVPVHSAGVYGETPYIVVGFIDGHNLRDHMPPLSAPLPATITFFTQAIEAIAYAHQQGIVHRDLKPSNIICKPDGTPVISDFGVAALSAGEPLTPFDSMAQGETLSNEARWTRTDATLGTPTYAAPEMQRTTHTYPAPAVDVWSLGVLLYEALTGQLPYPNLHAKPAERFAEPLVPPSRWRPSLPRSLDAIIQRCLALDPLDRYPTAKELGLALRHWLYQQQRRHRRRRLLGVGVAACLALGLTTMLVWPISAEKKHAAATQQLMVQLEKQGKLELIPATGAPTTAYIRLNADVAKTSVDEGVFVFDTARPALLELLPDVPFERYRFTAEMRQFSAINDPICGLYVNHNDAGPEDGHRLTYLLFADVSRAAHRYPGPNGQMGSALNLRCLHYIAPVPPPGLFAQHALGWTWYAPPPEVNNPYGPWRTIRLTVTPESLVGSLDEIVVKPANPRPATDQVCSPSFPKGGIGIYASNCQVQLRNCVIEKLP